VLKAISGVLDAEDGEIEKGSIQLFGQHIESIAWPRTIVRRRHGAGARRPPPVRHADGRRKPA
jgi:ribosomal protein S7